MRKNVTIDKILPSRTGVNERGDWCMTDMQVSWDEETASGETSQQRTVVTVSGWLNHGKIAVLRENNSKVNMTMYFGTREYEGKVFCSNRAYLPKELMCATKEESDQNTPF